MQRLRVPAAVLVGCIWTLAFLMGAATAIFALKNGNNRNGEPK